MGNEAQSPLSLRARLLSDLKDQKYRRGFVEGHATDTIAFQLRTLRKARSWDQREVAERLGNPKLQPMVSRYENPDYGRYSIKTLIELAAAFDVALIVRFAPFSELVEWDFASRVAQLAPPAFDSDSKLAEISAQIQREREAQLSNEQASGAAPQAFQLGSASLAIYERHVRTSIPVGNLLRFERNEPHASLAVGQ